ncbi:GNAT family N-acetyltransferase [Paenibacillus filicis]|uniref:GNAT family N-acetyltransferase n=1 Tax=Paenibacillus filicis TaxID=669464 RepID=A0ABU9DSQ0_9BACL
MTHSGQLLIRDARDSDKEVIRSLMLNAYSQYEQVLPAERWVPYRESISSSVDGDGPIARIVAEIDGRVVGSVQMYISGEVAYGRPELNLHSPIIRLLAVSPDVRGRGIATELIRESVRRSVALGATTLHLHTSDMMESAVKLYERLGFERASDKDIMNGETLVKSYRLQWSDHAEISHLVGQQA